MILKNRPQKHNKEHVMLLFCSCITQCVLCSWCIPVLVVAQDQLVPWTSSSARTSFPGTLKPCKFQKVAGGCAPSNPASRGDTPLKIPPCVCFSPQARRKTTGFLTVFCILQFGSISPYFNTFYTSYGV